MAKEFLTRKGVRYIEKNVASDSAAANEMVQLSGQRGVPVIVVDGQIIVGFDQGRLETALASSGESRPHLGVKVADAGKFAGRIPGIPLQGAYIGNVSPGSIAASADIRVGDVIVEINGQPVNGAEDLERLAANLVRQTTVSISLIRDGQRLSKNATA